MRFFSRIAVVALLITLGTSLGFGWGTLTHVYFANHLGARFGPLNQNEIYGATLNDVFGFDFTSNGFTADYALHTSQDVLWGLYYSAAGAEAKAAFYGMITHNNIDLPANIRGADFYAHGVYPLPLNPYSGGWIIEQGNTLVTNPEIYNYVVGLFPPETDQGTILFFLSMVGHNLTETAVDILVRDREDPLAGARLLLAAQNRSNEVPQVLGGVLAAAGLYDAGGAMKAEAAWQTQMKDYGKLFMLPDKLLIPQIATQTAGVALMFLQGLGVTPTSDIDPAKIVEFIHIAMNQVRPSYRHELAEVLCTLEKHSRNWPPVPGPIFAFWKDDDQELNALMASQQTPAAFALDQNYPNPFNPSTTIAYAVPADSRVTLKIYNSIGQEVATLVDGFVPAGRYATTWDARGLASGMYIYRLQSEGTVITQKMTLLK